MKVLRNLRMFKKDKCDVKGCNEYYTPLGYCPNGHFYLHKEYYDDRDDKTDAILFI